ncbi:MAG: NAD(P)H:quinone oxidoreductase [Candidatus Aerophobetes bacterium]
MLIVFYSMYGHILRMAKAAAEGVSDGGGQAILTQVAELMPEEQWDENVRKVKEAMKDIPVASPQEDLKGIDGLIVATPTRFGNMTSQMRNFWDQTGGPWMEGALIGKPAAVITSSNNQHGGQETTIVATMFTLLHHGCVLVGLPYSFKEQMTMEEISGGSPYGASTIAGAQGERMPSLNELAMARGLAERLTNIAERLRSTENKIE